MLETSFAVHRFWYVRLATRAIPQLSRSNTFWVAAASAATLHIVFIIENNKLKSANLENCSDTKAMKAIAQNYSIRNDIIIIHRINVSSISIYAVFAFFLRSFHICWR